MNTLDQPKPTSRETYFQSRVSRDASATNRSQKFLGAQHTNLHHSNQPPFKKLRINQPEASKISNNSRTVDHSGDAIDDRMSDQMYLSKASKMISPDMTTVASKGDSTPKTHQPGRNHALSRDGKFIDNRGVLVEAQEELIDLLDTREDDSGNIEQIFNHANQRKMKTRGYSMVSAIGSGRITTDDVLSVLSDGSSRDRARGNSLEEIFREGPESRHEPQEESPDPLQGAKTNQSIFKSRPQAATARPPKKRPTVMSRSPTRQVKPHEARETETWIDSHRYHNLIRLPLTKIQHGELLATENSYEFVIDPMCKTFFIDFQLKDLEDGQDPPVRPIDVSKITRIQYGDGQCCKALLIASQVGSYDNQYLLHLKSPRRVWELITELQKCDESLQVDPHPKKNGFFDNYRKNADRSLATMQGTDRSKKSEPTVSPHFDDARSSHHAGSDYHETKILMRQQRPRRGDPSSNTKPRYDEQLLRADQSINQKTTRSSPTSIDTASVQHQTVGYVQEQSTRSTKRATRSNKSYIEDPPPQPRFSESQGFPPPWKRDLIYPEKSKKRETIKYEDLLRLDDDEFLNDTLVAFFIRYLEVHVEDTKPDLLKKMHFFNSYFYERVSRGENGKRNDLNFDAVKKWTRNYDIFSRDFVVVPVNENLHWYLAIICNLTYFKKQNTNVDVEVGRADVVPSDEHDGKPLNGMNQPEEPSPTSAEKQSDSSSRLPYQAEKIHLSDNDGPEILSSSQLSTATKRKGKRKPRRSLPKYDTNLPIIITLDSLGLPRGKTISTLKDYIVKEAKDKQNWDIDIAEIRGMTAKEIPEQRNYSDCGIYLCAYLERFVQNPDSFVESILQRDPQRWPQMESRRLREGFRNLVIELHSRQEGQPPQNPIPEVGNILLNNSYEAQDQQEPNTTPFSHVEIVDEIEEAPNQLPATPAPRKKAAPTYRPSDGFAQSDSPDDLMDVHNATGTPRAQITNMEQFQAQFDSDQITPESARKRQDVIHEGNKVDTIMIDDDSPAKHSSNDVDVQKFPTSNPHSEPRLPFPTKVDRLGESPGRRTSIDGTVIRTRKRVAANRSISPQKLHLPREHHQPLQPVKEARSGGGDTKMLLQQTSGGMLQAVHVPSSETPAADMSTIHPPSPSRSNTDLDGTSLFASATDSWTLPHAQHTRRPEQQDLETYLIPDSQPENGPADSALPGGPQREQNDLDTMELGSESEIVPSGQPTDDEADEMLLDSMI